MSDTTFAPWVEPIAARFRSTRQEVAQLAGEIPDDAWQLPSPAEGWSYRDLLAHLAEGDMSVRNTVLVVVDKGDTDLRTWNNGREARIAASLRRGATLNVPQLIAQVLHEGEVTQQLLAQLSDEHETVQVITSRSDPTPRGLGECLRSYHHDEEHLAQLREAKLVRL